jgi:zinc transport system ATP-binding protein
MASLVEVKDLSFNFGSTQVLSNISFSINKGDFIGLIGPNGSGKTTLIKLLLGLYKPLKGTIKINNNNIASFSNWSKIGYVPQKATNFSDTFPATVQEVVLTGCLSQKRFPKRYSSKDINDALEFLKKVEMQDHAKKRIGELSGGQQQRVLIARALVTKPELLILDEPTTGVDQETQSKFYDLIGELNKEGISILLISHDLERITRYVTKVASLNKTLNFYGTHKEFCSHPKRDVDHHCLRIKPLKDCKEPHCNKEDSKC